MASSKVGVGSLYFAGAKSGRFPHISTLPDAGKQKPAHEGNVVEFLAANGGSAALKKMCQNKIKKCASCGKPCAFTLKNCNACGISLEAVEITYNDNVFMGFVFGIEKGNFPFTISMRSQTPEFLCFDDPLALTAAHLNVIPTDQYIPDWRFLLLNPTKGIAIADKMFETCATVMLEQFWSNAEFREKYFAGETPPTRWEDLRDIVNAGCNYPPSMYQLHLQFMHPPWVPFQWNLLTKDNHLHYARYFCIEYVRACLVKAQELGGSPIAIAEDTDIELLMDAFNEHGVNYDEYHSKNVRRTKQMQERFGRFVQDDFDYVALGDASKAFSPAFVAQEGKDPKEVQKDDAKVLNSYGRPFDAAGKNSNQYYKFAKKAEDITQFEG